MGTNKIHVFRYQPELSDTVIYWSLTLVLFFLSMIGLLERQGRINIFSIFTFLLFLFFSYIGTRRKMILTQEQLNVYAILKKNQYQIELEQIETVLVGSHGVTIKTKETDFAYLMFKKSKSKLVEQLDKESQFKGTILSVEKSVD